MIYATPLAINNSQSGVTEVVVRRSYIGEVSDRTPGTDEDMYVLVESQSVLAGVNTGAFTVVSGAKNGLTKKAKSQRTVGQW